MIKYDYDVLIIGAGPAGSTTARFIKPDKNKITTLIIERKKEIGKPVQCGEAISKLSEWNRLIPNYANLKNLFIFSKNVIANEVKDTNLISPNKEIIRFKTPGYILNRDKLDKYLAKLAVDSGAELRLKTSLKNIINKHTIITSNGKITANIIVGADGPKSPTANFFDIKTPNYFSPLSECTFSIVKGNFYSNTKRVYIGKKFAGGYAWFFPKGDTANIGFGTEWIHKISIKEAFNTFIKDLGISKNDIVYTHRGLIPMGGPIQKFVSENVMIVGDAAGMVFPSNGGGIVPAMIGGKECGIAISNYYKKGIPLESYEKQWKELLGNIFKESLKLKNSILWMTNHDLFLEYIFKLFRKKISSIGTYLP